MDHWYNFAVGLIFIVVAWGLIISFVALLNLCISSALNLRLDQNDRCKIERLFVLSLIYLATFLILLWTFDFSLFKLFGVDTEDTIFELKI